MAKPLQVISTADLQQQLANAGCVFDFAVFRVLDNPLTGETLHRIAMAEFCQQIEENYRQKNPDFANGLFKLDQARPVQLECSDIYALCAEDSWLERAFLDPPYRSTLNRADFHNWLDALQLRLDEGLEAWDWVGDPDLEPEQSNWSRYFDEGKEWWGIWCISIYNPQQQTISVFAASASD